jgi:hypothetical protein
LTRSHDSIHDLELIAIHAETWFVFTDAGRIQSENKPDLSSGPRFIMAGSTSGNAFRVHKNVDEETAGALETLAATEPPFFDPHRDPGHLVEYQELLSASDEQIGQGLNYVFPVDFTYDHQVAIIRSGTPEGDEMFSDKSFADVMPPGLQEIGFRTPADIWEPWCIALHDGEIASIAETVRNGSTGVEVGVDTTPEMRGRGYGAAATASWALHPAIRDRVRFYGHAKSNESSRRVTERLGLRYIGMSLRIA